MYSYYNLITFVLLCYYRLIIFLLYPHYIYSLIIFLLYSGMRHVEAQCPHEANLSGGVLTFKDLHLRLRLSVWLSFSYYALRDEAPC